MNERFYLLKIRLLEIELEIEPEIWRRFAVPASISLDRLHGVIQIVMGWTDSHLHEFQICAQKGDGMMDRRKKIVTTSVTCATKYLQTSNNTRHASAGFGLKRAPRRVTFKGAWE